MLKVLPRLDTITIQGFTSFRQHQEYYYGSDNHLRHYHYICGWLHTDNKTDLQVIQKMSLYQENKDIVFGGKVGRLRNGSLHIMTTLQLARLNCPRIESAF